MKLDIHIIHSTMKIVRSDMATPPFIHITMFWL